MEGWSEEQVSFGALLSTLHFDKALTGERSQRLVEMRLEKRILRDNRPFEIRQLDQIAQGVLEMELKRMMLT
jgi:hypothetical protein